jgi:aminoglycoside phosphotransferase (APT) family kinase protein
MGDTFTTPLQDVHPVDIQHRFDEAALERWMQANVNGFDGPLTVLRYKGGQSNPTYRLETPNHAYVLRRKPFGALLPTAHAVEREYRLISALETVRFPVPHAHAICHDPSVIGATFYLMDAVEGEIHWDATLPNHVPDYRRRAYEGMISTLADLHRVDYAAIGLGDYGRPGNYFSRQLDRWTKQYRVSQTRLIDKVERLVDWLPKTIPEQVGTSIVHGDYRIDNLVVAKNGDGIAAVLDWELSTLGDPLADLSYMLMHWELPVRERGGLSGLDLRSLGIPSRDEATKLYCLHLGRSDVPILDWYFAYNIFRLASRLAEISWDFALRAGA